MKVAPPTSETGGLWLGARPCIKVVASRVGRQGGLSGGWGGLETSRGAMSSVWPLGAPTILDAGLLKHKVRTWIVERHHATMSDRLSGLRGKVGDCGLSVGLSRLVAQVHLPPEDGAEGEHAMAKEQLMVRERG